MKNAGKMILILTLSFGLQTFSFSQEKITLTLEECIRLALLQNPFYEAEKAKEEQASYYVREAISRFLPSLNAQGMDVLDKNAFSLQLPVIISRPAPAENQAGSYPDLSAFALLLRPPIHRRPPYFRL